jgi:phenylpropionate dioxygenase-like ring-hydroxylating dioxygenase large terminal subunit
VASQPLDDPVLIDDWHVVAMSHEVTQTAPLGVRLLGRDIVLWRFEGQVLAWLDLCVHRGTRLSLGTTADGLLTCPYHGWTYDHTGRCVLIPAHPEQKPPARAAVKVYTAVERYGWVWMTIGVPAVNIPEFPEWADDSFRKIHCGPYRFSAAAPRVVENFLDVAHFPFVHEGFLGDREHAEISDYEVTTDEKGVTAEDITVWQPNPDGTGIGKPVTYTYRVFRPLTAYFTKRADQVFSIYFNVTPVDFTTSIGWMCEALNYAHDLSSAELRGFQDEVTAQDVPIVESQRPELLPLDLQAELHLRSDKTSIAYRRWLNELGLTYGTA